MNDEIKVPPGLRSETRKWFMEVISGWALDGHHVKLLEAACRELDRAEEARLALKKSGGSVFVDRWGQPKESPWRKIEREARISYARLLREMNLDMEPPSSPARPPILSRNGGQKYA